MLRDLTNVETIYRRQLKTVRIKLQRDYAGTKEIELVTVSSPAEVNEIAKAIFSGLDDDQEHFVLLVCNAANEITGFKVIASGAQDHVSVDVKLVFRNALLLGASRVIVLHNHPSGMLVPSPPDLKLTRKLADAGHVLDIELLDHIIWSPQGYSSLSQKHPRLFERSPLRD
ncbi:MAG: JAB domain-containing protein [Proteobacteria bacterium]|nr:JAB domain-containing protein [Pseudomonadota bacterium]